MLDISTAHISIMDTSKMVYLGYIKFKLYISCMDVSLDISMILIHPCKDRYTFYWIQCMSIDFRYILEKSAHDFDISMQKPIYLLLDISIAFRYILEKSGRIYSWVLDISIRIYLRYIKFKLDMSLILIYACKKRYILYWIYPY